jgi:hypothetical protein
MKNIMVFFLFFFSMSSYSEDYKKISLKEGEFTIPANWIVNKNNKKCLIINQKNINAINHLKLCRTTYSEDGDYFTTNDDGEWEAVTDGIPVLADVSVTSQFTGMSAIVSCKHKDEAGYHTEQCFQAEINLPQKINFIFNGRGDSSLFEDYKRVYLSFKIK